MHAPDGDEPLDRGVAGSSARREHDRRRANREQRTRERHPRIGGALLALRQAPGHEQVWATGAIGEERVAAYLDRHLGASAIVLHDRCIRSRANIDHIAIVRSGVWVIDSKRYKGKVAIERSLFGAAKLKIAGRDRTALVGGLAKQVALVEPVLAAVGPGIALHGALCFVDADLPTFGRLRLDGCPIVHPRGLVKLLKADGPLGAPEDVARIARRLAEHFPAA